MKQYPIMRAKTINFKAIELGGGGGCLCNQTRDQEGFYLKVSQKHPTCTSQMDQA